MYAKAVVLLMLIALVAGCTQSMSADKSLEQSIDEMQNFMRDNPGSVPETPVGSDQGFESTAIKTGSFENINYMTSGSASITEKDGKHYVVLGSDFSTPNGPDLVLYLTKNINPSTRDDIRAGRELQKLKSTNGMQVYELPVGINTGEYNSVTIHCKAFNVPWSYAPLS